MNPFRSLSVTCALALACVAAGPRVAQAQVTIYNRTQNDVYIAYARYAIITDSSSIGQPDNSAPGWVHSNGWFKVPRYGGSTNVPHGCYVRVGGKDCSVKDAKRFPIDAHNATDFNQTFGRGEDFWRTGSLQAAATRKGLSLEWFAPVEFFFDRQAGESAITDDKLAELGRGQQPNPPPRPSGPTLPPPMITITVTNPFIVPVEFRLNDGPVLSLNPKQTHTYPMTGDAPVVRVKQRDGSFMTFSVTTGGSYSFLATGKGA